VVSAVQTVLVWSTVVVGLESQRHSHSVVTSVGNGVDEGIVELDDVEWTAELELAVP
jgi:hypothetical protein